MASNFDLVGLSFSDLSEVSAVFEDPRFSTEEVDFAGTRYVCCADGNGAELWAGIHGENFMQLNPIFTTGATCSCTIDAVPFPNPDYGDWEAMLDLTLYRDEQIETRLRALSVNIPERIGRRSRWLPGLVSPGGRSIAEFARSAVPLHVCVFSHETALFDSEEEFAAANTEFQLDSQSFFPEGMFASDEGDASPMGFGAGIVASCGLAEQTFTGIPYCWASVETCGGVFGAVWSPDTAPSARDGQIISYRGMMIVKAAGPFWATS